MSGSTILEPPAQLKAIASFMKVASDIERIDPVVAYWVRLYSTETALSIDRETPDCKKFLNSVILYLEQFKRDHKDNEAVTNQTVGQAHTENFIVALFTKVDTLDRDGVANKNTVRMFYMAAVLFEAMAVFGPLNEEITKRAKYAKFKAAYIQKCLKAGQTPKPGPIDGSDLEAGGSGEQSSEPSANVDEKPAQVDSSGLDLPQVPKGANSNGDQDPYILTPSKPPQQPPNPLLNSTSEHHSSMPTWLPSSPVPVPKPVTVATPASNSCEAKSTISATKFHATNGSPLNAEDLLQSQKYCKFANSALQYDDINTAVSNLEKALKLLTTGQRSD